ncbi:hypothetical protein ABZ705_33250, partial [Streptomyces sp. NPDC006984]
HSCIGTTVAQAGLRALVTALNDHPAHLAAAGGGNDAGSTPSGVRAMDCTPMPEPLRRAIHHLVSESVQNCQEVLRYTEPDQAHTWKRMTLYRATDAADTIDMMALLIAAYCEHTDMDPPRCRTASRVERSRSVLTAP